MDAFQTQQDKIMYSTQNSWQKLLRISYKRNVHAIDNLANKLLLEKFVPRIELKLENHSEKVKELNNHICSFPECYFKCEKYTSLPNYIRTIEYYRSKIMNNNLNDRLQQKLQHQPQQPQKSLKQQPQHPQLLQQKLQRPPAKKNSLENPAPSPGIQVNMVTTYSHLDMERYTCPHEKCDFESKFHLAVKQHVEAVHTSILFKCSVCQKQFKTKAYLKRHSVTHLKSHSKHIFCAYPNCDYKCHRMEYLKSHMRIHRKEKMFGCQLCPQRFNHSNSLKRHMTLSHGEEHSSFKNVFECPLCDYSSESSYHLNRHIRVHTGHKPYKCEQCPFAAVQKSDLTVHMMTHTGEKPLSCTYCEFKCARSNVLKRHERTHTGERPYKCTQCSYSAAESGTLRSHVRTQHKIGQRYDD